jgi:phosphoadenosine phosphosulfate reductase
VLASALGPQSLAILDMLQRARLAVDVLFLDTGLHFAETLALKEEVERRYGLRIRAVEPELSLSEQARRCGERLWQRDPDRCCAERKLEPMRRALAGYDAWISGIRRSQSPARARAQPLEWDARHGLHKVNPLVAWSREQVERYLREHDVPRHPLLARGYASVGCRPCTSPLAPGESDERAGRWRGTAKDECGLHLPPG